MNDCLFCRIVAGAADALIVDEDEHTLAFLDVAPATEGHTLVVPKRHARDLLTIGDEDATAVMRAVRMVARMLDDSLSPDGITLFQANGAVGWQHVFHLHVHVVPRWNDDALTTPWEARRAPLEALAAVARRLRSRTPAGPSSS